MKTGAGHESQGAGLTIAPVAHNRQLWPTRRVIFALALVLSLPILAVWLFRSRGQAPTGIRSLAVLPLDNLSGDASQGYFADGMTDELITDLSQISALRVISRTSVMVYKGARKPLPQIARELNVDAVVEGTVLRSGDQVRITAQLIEPLRTSTYGPRATRVSCVILWRSRTGWLEPLQTKFGSI